MTDKEIIASQEARIKELEGLLVRALDRIKELEDQVKDLKAQLKSNSGNSNKPPSSDWGNKKPAIPRKKGRKRGGKKGHKGRKLDFVEIPDKVLVHSPTGSCSCGHFLSEEQVHSSAKGRQVFDLPKQLLEVTEHRVGSVKCSKCGQVHQGDYPKQVRALTQYGNRIRALVVMLNVEQSLPVQRICDTVKALTGQKINPATIQNILKGSYQSLAAETAAIQDKILEQQVAHADESGIRVEAKNHWVHNLSTERWTHFFVHLSRGFKALESQDSITNKFLGILVSDFWGSYFKLKKVEGHAMCGAHLIRELRGISERFPEKKWADKISAVLLYLYHFSNKGRSTVDEKKWKAVSNYYDNLIKEGLAGEPPPQKRKHGKSKRTKAANLLIRLRDKKTAVLRFASELKVPFTNNLAERDLRPWKTKLKVSTSFRTFEGAQRYARIKGFCSTLRKQNINLFYALHAVLAGKYCFANR